MNKGLNRAFLLTSYCIPFVFLSMYGDATYDTMWLYGLMIAGFSILAFRAIKSKQFWIVPLGNIISIASSYIFIQQFCTDKWKWYFKPLTANTFMMVVSIVVFVIQMWFVWHYYTPRK